jgi:hypothetical protein
MSDLFYFTAKNGEPEWSNKRELLDFLLPIEGKKLYAVFKRVTGQRTGSQNDALHLWFTFLAEALNEAGLTVQEVLAQKMELNWTPYMVKELLWKEAQKRLYGKDSTAKLDKVSEIDNIHDHLTRHLGEKFHIEYIPFPHDPQKLIYRK